MLFSQSYACPEHGVSVEELTPRMFSFNNPFGACPHTVPVWACFRKLIRSWWFRIVTLSMSFKVLLWRWGGIVWTDDYHCYDVLSGNLRKIRHFFRCSCKGTLQGTAELIFVRHKRRSTVSACATAAGGRTEGFRAPFLKVPFPI